MLQNAYFLAKIGADRAENEQHFAEIWQAPGQRPGAGGADGVEPPRVPGVIHTDWYHALKQKGATDLIWTIWSQRASG